ncbi:MAG: FadR family transcriptional regulator [Synergistes sp.]|nr:FadR family transcriptional regulator [Synergistes sp.]
MAELILKQDGKKESKKKIVSDKLRELIETNSFAQGDKLPSERELAQMLGVSRNLLREAVVSLSAEGVLEVRERQGIFVKNVEGYDVLESLQGIQLLPAEFILYQLEVRTIISVPAARLAAQRRTDEDIRKLRECYKSFAACPYSTTEELEQSGKWEALLHHLETEAAHNPILSRINESVNVLVEKNNLILHPNLAPEGGWVPHIIEQHAKIIKAIEERDPKTAGDVLLEHMTESVKMMREKHPEIVARISSPVLLM